MAQKQLQGTQVAEDSLILTGIDGSGLINVDAISINTYVLGSGANNIVQLDGSSKLPAVDGSLLTNLPPGGILAENNSNIYGGSGGTGGSIDPAQATENIIIGQSSALLLQFGDYNTVIGNHSLVGDVASNNGCVGYRSLATADDPNGAIAIGAFAAESAIIAPDVAIGNKIGQERSSLFGSVLVGSGVANGIGLIENVTNTIGIGSGVLQNSGTTTNSVVIGTSAGRGINTTLKTDSTDCVFIGTGAGQNNTSGTRSVCIGRDAGYGDATAGSTGGRLTTIGYQAGKYSLTNSQDTFIGYLAGEGVVGTPLSGNNNVAVGFTALRTLTTGTNNIGIGAGTGASVATGYNNICVGPNAGPTTDTNNKLFIAITQTDTPLIGADFVTSFVTINGTLVVTGGVDALTSATTVIDVASATAPSIGQILTATSSTAATWQDVDFSYVDDNYVALSGDTMTGDLLLSSGTQILADIGTVANPGISFSGDSNTGIYQTGPNANQLSFSCAGVNRLHIEGNGTLNVTGTTDYETLVAHDDDIPNKKYVDDNDRLTINAKTANYTLLITDENNLVTMNNAAANTLTIPTNASVAFPIGTQILVSQEGAGTTTIAGSGVTLHSAGGLLSLTELYSTVSLIKKGTDTWLVAGDLS